MLPAHVKPYKDVTHQCEVPQAYLIQIVLADKSNIGIGVKSSKKIEANHLYWHLFWSTFYISAFTVGGGFVIIPLLKKKFADEYHWIDEEEMLDLAAIAQSAPGALAVNASMLVGYRVAGIPGMLVSIIATILPPFILLSIISIFYDALRSNAIVAALLKGMAAGVAAVIVDVVIDLGKKEFDKKDPLAIVIMVTAFCITFFTDINVVFVIIACIVIGVIRVLINKRHGSQNGPPRRNTASNPSATHDASPSDSSSVQGTSLSDSPSAKNAISADTSISGGDET